MDKLKILETTKDLKFFFEKKKIKVSEAKESMFRLIDYIDNHFDEDSLDIPFRNGHITQPVSSKGLSLPVSPLQRIIKREPLSLYNKTGGKHR